MLACVSGSSCFATALSLLVQCLLQLCGGEHTEAAWQLAFPEDAFALDDLQQVLDACQAASESSI